MLIKINFDGKKRRQKEKSEIAKTPIKSTFEMVQVKLLFKIVNDSPIRMYKHQQVVL